MCQFRTRCFNITEHCAPHASTTRIETLMLALWPTPLLKEHAWSTRQGQRRTTRQCPRPAVILIQSRDANRSRELVEDDAACRVVAWRNQKPILLVLRYCFSLTESQNFDGIESERIMILPRKSHKGSET